VIWTVISGSEFRNLAVDMPRLPRVHNPSIVIVHPLPRYRDRIRLHRYRRGPTYATWEASFKVGGVWSTPASLKTADDVEAHFVSVEELNRREAGVIPLSRKSFVKTFGAAADLATERLQVEREAAKKAGQKTIAHGCRQLIDRIATLRAHFGPLTIADIKKADVRKYLDNLMVQDRSGGVGATKRPAQSTIGNLNHAWLRVSEAAMREGWIVEDDKLTLSRRGFGGGDARVSITTDDMLTLARFMSDEWVETGRNRIERETRRLLRSYVAIAATTGIRPGNELGSVRVRHVQFQATYVRITVPAKTAKTKSGRSVAVFENDAFDVRAILSDMTIGRMKDDLLFSRANGLVPDFSRRVRELFDDAGVRVDGVTGQQRTSYSLRHYYATESLIRGTAIRYLAAEMGTSVAMIERHYDGVVAETRHAALSGAQNQMGRLRAALRRQVPDEHEEAYSEEEEYADVIARGDGRNG